MVNELEKMKRYIERTKMGEKERYSINYSEVRELGNKARCDNGGIFTAICLAFEYGVAKGYRAAKKEAQA